MSLAGTDLTVIPDGALRALERDTRRALTERMVARAVVDFDGPHGLDYGALNLGTLEPFDLGAGTIAGKRALQPLVELRVPFSIPRSDLDAAARGAPDFNTNPAVTAALRLAEYEDRAVFYGLEAAGIVGLSPASPHPILELGSSAESIMDAVARALITLDEAAVSGPYAIVLGSRCYRTVAGSVGTYPLLAQLRKLVDGPVLHSRVLEGALVVSLRGGDFLLSVGQDAALAYANHDAVEVQLYLAETFTFRALSPEAAVRLGGSADDAATSG